MDIEDSKEPEVIELNKQNKINFFKKVLYSITKPSKYENMREEGVDSAIRYFLSLLAILAIIVSIISTIIQVNVVISYLEQKLPDISFKDNILSLESEDATILDEPEFKEYFGVIAVINPLLEKDQAINEYYKLTTTNYNTVVFLSDKYIVINNEYNPENNNNEGIEEHKYADESSKYIEDTSITYTKDHIISYLKSKTPYTYYLAQYFVIYFILIGIVFIFIIALISLSLWIVTKLSKVKWGFKKSLMNTIYSSTLSMITYVAYMIIRYFSNFTISIIDIISVMLIFIYIFILLYKEKKTIINKEK